MANAPPEAARWVFGGRKFFSIKAAWHQAAREGFDGTFSTFVFRVKRGASRRWEDLIKPTDKARVSRANSGKARARQEMADCIAAMDARKRGL